MSEEQALMPPPYPCVAVLAKGMETLYKGEKLNADGDVTGQTGKQIVEVEALRFVPVRSYDDTIPHLEHLRREKGWPVIGHHNLEKLPGVATGEEKKDVAKLRKAVHDMVNNPEVQLMRRAYDELVAKNAELAAALAEVSIKAVKGKAKEGAGDEAK